MKKINGTFKYTFSVGSNYFIHTNKTHYTGLETGFLRQLFSFVVSIITHAFCH